MLRISIQSRTLDEADEYYSLILLVNGELIPDSEVHHSDGNRVYAHLNNVGTTHVLAPYTLRELQTHFVHLRFPRHSPFPDLHTSATLILDDDENPGMYLQATYRVFMQEWAGPWSIADYDRAISLALTAKAESRIALDDDSFSKEDGLWRFNCILDDPGATAESVLERWLPITDEIIRQAQATLTAEIDRDTLVTLFDFPQHVSTACEQYLLYFVQFLRDLGIEAGASITHEARQVLFSVTPTEGAEALDRIREALDIYLRLPDSPEFAAQAPRYGDIAVQQLQANIYHLKGQLMVADAVLQARDAQIQALQLSNFTYQQLLATQQQAATLPLLPASTSGADAEPLVPGVIEVTKYEGKGFTVNLPELLRRLKRSFSQQ
jgi:hypothetical protein